MALFGQSRMLEEVAWPRFGSVPLQGAGPFSKGCSHLKLGHLRRTWGHRDDFLFDKCPGMHQAPERKTKVTAVLPLRLVW